MDAPKVLKLILSLDCNDRNFAEALIELLIQEERIEELIHLNGLINEYQGYQDHEVMAVKKRIEQKIAAYLNSIK